MEEVEEVEEVEEEVEEEVTLAVIPLVLVVEGGVGGVYPATINKYSNITKKKEGKEGNINIPEGRTVKPMWLVTPMVP